jgi:uncharacterized repeat protein (TIGR01451 family)
LVMATYKYDSSTGTYILIDDSSLQSSISVATDLADYAPGSTATFTANVGVGDTVTFNVADVAGLAVSGTNAPWTITDGGAGDLDGVANGVIQTSWAVGQDAAGEAFVLSATDQTAGVMVTTAFTDSAPHTPVPAVVPATLTNGIVFLTGDVNTATGTGIFPSFVQIQGDNQSGGTSYNNDGLSSTEEGFNTLNPPIEDSGSSAVHNHPLLFSAVPTVVVGGVTYREFRLDLNDQGTTINLDSLKIYKAATGDLTSLSGATELYNMDGGADGKTGGVGDVDVSVVLTAWASGSGHSDYKVLIPDTYFTGTNGGDFIYLYSAFSDANSGFEEWSVGPTSPTTPGSTPDAVVGIDKQISVDGIHWLDVGAYNTIDGSATAPVLLTGSPVYYQVLLTNNTTPNASDPDPLMTLTSLTDANGPTLTASLGGDGHNVGDANHNGKWDVGETWVFTGTLDHAASGLQVDTATALVSVTDSNGTTTGTNDDQANYIGVTPKIAIDKVTVDGSSSGDNLTILAGEAISWTYTVTNTGDVALSNVSVTDSVGGVTPHYVSGDTNLDGKLDTNETWIYSASGVATVGTYSNVGTAGGSFTDSAGHTATPGATDGSGYFGADPEIAINKVTVDGSASGDNLTILAGEAISWTYTVTNAGNVALSNVSVTDSVGGVTPSYVSGDTNHDGKLDTNETWIYSASGVATVGTYSNVGTAGGSFTDSAGHKATPGATDGSGYFGADPEIAINKVTIGGNQTGDGINIIAGTPVTWQYTVTNVGNVALSSISVTDSVSGVNPTYVSGDTNGNHMLDLNETWVYKATGTAVLGSYSNIGTAKGSFTDTAGHTGTDTATDGSSYAGFEHSALTQGFWGSHTDAWDGVGGNAGNPTKSAAGSGVLWSQEILPAASTATKPGYLLLGDANGDGTANDAHDLWISLALAQSIESSSTSGDARMIMLQQAIATQLNIDNHVVQPNNLIDEAVMWLTNKGAWAGLGVNVDASSDGVVDQAGTASKPTLAGVAVATSSTAWHNLVTVTDDPSYVGLAVKADGEGLKNALMYFNQDQLVTSPGTPGLVGWTPDGTNVVNAHLNTIDEFWLTLHQTGGLTGIA